MSLSFDIPSTESTPSLDASQREIVFARLSNLLAVQDAVVIAHYYTDPDLQRLAEATGGFVGDSLAMAAFGVNHPATTLMIVGVRFMGESAKILSPKKRVLMPTLEATCSLDLGCPAEAFAEFRQQHPDRTVVVYCNTSAAVKAQADWVVTSSNAVAIVDHLEAQGKKILWAPDRYLGRYVQSCTKADMVFWEGSCIVHNEYKAQSLRLLKAQYPHAAVLVHPESPPDVVAEADVVGSTSKLLKASQELPNKVFIVATDRGIFYKMQSTSPDKTFIEAPTGGEGGPCHSCGHCPWMAKNNLHRLEESLLTGSNEVIVDPVLIQKAKVPLERMLNFKSG